MNWQRRSLSSAAVWLGGTPRGALDGYSGINYT